MKEFWEQDTSNCSSYLTPELRESLEDLVDEILFDYGLNDALFNRNFDKWKRTAYGLSFVELYNCYWECGATKAVLIFNEDSDYYGWCIKFPYNFHGSNFCEFEYNNYIKAVEQSLSNFFPYTDIIGESAIGTIYVQEYAECDYYENKDFLFSKMSDSEYYYESYSAESDTYESYSEFISLEEEEMGDEERVSLFLEDDYDWEEIDGLIDFLEEEDINDMHAGNFGTSLRTGKRIIIDFSGYF